MERPVTVISGTRKGIGRFLAEHYLALGHTVIGCSRRTPEWTADHYTHFCCDVSREEDVTQLFASIRREFGRIDHLINNAGIAFMNHVLLTPMACVNEVFQTNVGGTFMLSREAAKLMKAGKWGRVVNFSSIAVPLKLQGEAIYAASKSAIETLTKVLAYELAPNGITVNAVGPGPVETDLIRHIPQEKITALVARQAIPRMATLEDVANVVDFFIRPESSFITGQVVYLGGV